MPAEHQAVYNTFTENFLRLPRELRDLIYAEVYGDSAPIPLEDVQVDPAGMALSAIRRPAMDPGFAAEILEAFYTHGTFSVTFSDPVDVRRVWPAVKWGPHPQYHQYIRKLIVHAQEADLGAGASLEDLEYRCLDTTCLTYRTRTDWEHLLSLPRLEQLTVRLQKRGNDYLSWVDFSPILVELRYRLPKLQTLFSVSFDTILECYWSDPIWDNYTEPGNVVEEPYDPMGFVDVTELIEAPTEEDIAYVQENLPRQLRTCGQDILRGLLDETAPQRRALALHYVVKEPALLKVRMMEHYEVYKRMKEVKADHSSWSA